MRIKSTISSIGKVLSLAVAMAATPVDVNIGHNESGKIATSVRASVAEAVSISGDIESQDLKTILFTSLSWENGHKTVITRGEGKYINGFEFLKSGILPQKLYDVMIAGEQSSSGAMLIDRKTGREINPGNMMDVGQQLAAIHGDEADQLPAQFTAIDDYKKEFFAELSSGGMTRADMNKMIISLKVHLDMDDDTWAVNKAILLPYFRLRVPGAAERADVVIAHLLASDLTLSPDDMTSFYDYLQSVVGFQILLEMNNNDLTKNKALIDALRSGQEITPENSKEDAAVDAPVEQVLDYGDDMTAAKRVADLVNKDLHTGDIFPYMDQKTNKVVFVIEISSRADVETNEEGVISVILPVTKIEKEGSNETRTDLRLQIKIITGEDGKEYLQYQAFMPKADKNFTREMVEFGDKAIKKLLEKFGLSLDSTE